MRLCLVEDNAVAGLEPLTLTRPVYELLLGASPLGSKIAKRSGSGRDRIGSRAVIRPHLAAVQQLARPAYRRQRSGLAGPRPGARGNGRWVPPAGSSRPSDRPRGWGSAMANPPAPGRAGGGRRARAERNRALVRRPTPPGLAAWSSAASGSTGPGTSSPTMPITSCATSRPTGRSA